MKYLIMFCMIFSTQAELKRTINNELKMNWPDELVHLDFPASSTEAGIIYADYRTFPR